MRYLFFDTETVGLPANYRAPITDIANWPRLVQLAWLVCDDELPPAPQVRCYIVRPDGFEIPAAASDIHGITNALALESGHSLRLVLSEFLGDTLDADVLGGHNVDFDRHIVGAEVCRIRCENTAKEFFAQPHACTMQIGTDLCKLPGKGYGWKRPKLNELYRHLFGREPEVAHRADADMVATAECWFELLNRGLCGAAAIKSHLEAAGI